MQELNELPILYRYVDNKFKEPDLFHKVISRDSFFTALNLKIVDNCLKSFYDKTGIKQPTFTSLSPSRGICETSKYFIVIPIGNFELFHSKFINDLKDISSNDFIASLENEFNLTYLASSIKKRLYELECSGRHDRYTKVFLLFDLWNILEKEKSPYIEYISKLLIDTYENRVIEECNSEVLVYTKEYLLFDFQLFFNKKFDKKEEHKYWYTYLVENGIKDYSTLFKLIPDLYEFKNTY